MIAVSSKRTRRDAHPLYFLSAKPLLQNLKATLPTVGGCLAEHQRWHARQMIGHIAALVQRGWSDGQLVAELLP